MRTKLTSKHSILCVFAIACSALPALAQVPGGSKTFTGTTTGAFSLSSISNKDSVSGQFCLGFGDHKPDHVFELQSAVPNMKFRLESSANTTLLIQLPNKQVRCGGTTIQGTDWPAGTYNISVGSIESGQQHRYTLHVE